MWELRNVFFHKKFSMCPELRISSDSNIRNRRFSSLLLRQNRSKPLRFFRRFDRFSSAFKHKNRLRLCFRQPDLFPISFWYYKPCKLSIFLHIDPNKTTIKMIFNAAPFLLDNFLYDLEMSRKEIMTMIRNPTKI